MNNQTTTTEPGRDTYTRALRALADLIDVDNLPTPINIDLDDYRDRLRVQVHSRDWDAWRQGCTASGSRGTIFSLRDDITFAIVTCHQPGVVMAALIAAERTAGGSS